MGPPERSAQPRAHRHRPLPLSHSPDGCAPGAPSRVEAAIAENSPKTSESAKSLSRAGGQLVRAVPGSLRTSPGELLPAVYALRKAPTRSGALDSISRGGKGVKSIEILDRNSLAGESMSLPVIEIGWLAQKPRFLSLDLLLYSTRSSAIEIGVWGPASRFLSRTEKFAKSQRADF